MVVVLQSYLTSTCLVMAVLPQLPDPITIPAAAPPSTAPSILCILLYPITVKPSYYFDTVYNIAWPPTFLAPAWPTA